jgi:Carbohydrate-binding module 48 (Isoamylase N-terminal domain)
MSLITIPRRVAKLEYSAVRLPFALVGRHVVGRYWDDEAGVRRNFERLLGSLDQFAGRLLGDEDISRRGHALRRRTEFAAMAREHGRKAQARRAQPGETLPAAPSEVLAAGREAREDVSGISTVGDEQKPEHAHVRGEADARTSAKTSPTGHAAEQHAAGRHDPSMKPAAPISTVDVMFALPPEVQAGRVALCGDFNEWSADSIKLERDSGGYWRVTVPLERGHSYRYRYLLDGRRWENDWQAESYARNSYGSDDSVIFVE